MAGDWIKFEKATIRKPEILRIARLLGVNRHDALGRCVEFWAWADDVCIDGVVLGIGYAHVDEMVSCPGFSAAVESVGWVRFDIEKETMTLPNFDRHNGETSKKRALSKNRMESKRSRDSYAKSVTNASPEKRREENKTNTSAAKQKIGWTEQAGFDIPDQFLQAWTLSYPALDLKAQIARAHVWCLSNPADRPRSKFSRFLNGWFAREQRKAPLPRTIGGSKVVAM